MNKLIDFEYAQILINNGIMECHYKPELELNLELTKVMVSERIKAAGGKSYPCLFVLSSLSNVTHDAREYLAKDGNDFVKASALVVNSPKEKMLANFFIAVNKPLSPTRLFTDKEAALEWLQQFK